MIDKLFLVATEFKFEAGSALLASKQIQDAASGIQTAVNGALGTVQNFGLAVGAQIGIAHLGLVGLLQEAIHVSDSYQKLRLSFVNSLGANQDHLLGPIKTYNDQLKFTDAMFQKIGKAARDFSLDENQFAHMFMMTNNMLMPMGAAGKDMSNSMDISRTLLKSLPSLNMVPGQINGELNDIISGRASMNNTLFRRLSTETNVFKGSGAGASGHNNGVASMFNALTATKRVELLSKALGVFSSNTQVLEANVNTLSGQLRRLTSLFTGEISSVLRPVGDILNRAIIPVLKYLGDYIDKNGRQIIKNISSILRPWLEDLQGTYVTLKQLHSLKADINITKKIAELVTLFSMVRWIMTFFNVSISFSLIASLQFLFQGLTAIGRAVIFAAPWIARFAVLMVEMFWWIPLVLGGLQLLSRAKAIADVENVKSAAHFAPAITKEIDRIQKSFWFLVSPITKLWNELANLLSWIFRMELLMRIVRFTLQTLADSMENLAFQSVALYSALEVMYKSFKSWTADTISGDWGNKTYDLQADLEATWKKNMAALRNPENQMVSGHVTNISGGVHINNQFKEQLEPDRIAFTIRDQLLSAARNPISARGSVARNTGSKQ